MLIELVILFALHADDKNEAEQLSRAGAGPCRNPLRARPT
jgi:hypothetical protein